MQHIIGFSCEGPSLPDGPTREMLSRAIRSTLAFESIAFCAEVSVLFVTNEQIRDLNAEYRDKDRVTDVLSFPLYDTREELMDDVATNTLAHSFAIGDVVIAPDFVREKAEEIEEPYERHLCRMCIHSVLHLLGYDHELGPEQDREMMEKQETILDSLK